MKFENLHSINLMNMKQSKSNNAIRFIITAIAILLFSNIAITQTLTLNEGNWSENAVSYRGQLGKQILIHFPANGSSTGNIYGTNIYTDDSPIAVAAVHAGIISFEKGGIVIVEIVEGKNSYEGSTRNGVSSRNYAAWQGSYKLIKPENQNSANQSLIIESDWNQDAQAFRGQSKSQHSFHFQPNANAIGNVWGTDVYTDDSKIAIAAVHAGLITPQTGGNVTIEICEGRSNYSGSSRNGITTNSYGAFQGSFVFINSQGSNTSTKEQPNSIGAEKEVQNPISHGSLLPRMFWNSLLVDTKNSSVIGIVQDENFNTYSIATSGSLSWIAKTSASGISEYLYPLAGTNVKLTSIQIDKNKKIWLFGTFSKAIEYKGKSITGTERWNTFRLITDLDGNLIEMLCLENLFVSSVDMSANGNVYIGGKFNTQIKIDQSTYTPIGLINGLIIKFNQNGSINWSKQIRPSSSEGKTDIASICVSGEDCILSGNVLKGLLYQSNTEVTINSGNKKGFYISKVNSDGTFSWIKTFTSTGEVEFNQLKEWDNSIWITGSYIGSYTWENITLPVCNTWQAMIIKVNQGGTLDWIKTTTGAGDKKGLGIDIYGNNLVAIGNYSNGISWNKKPMNLTGEKQLPGVLAGYLLFIDKLGNINDFYNLSSKSAASINSINVKGASLLIGGDVSAPALLNAKTIGDGNREKKGFIAKFITIDPITEKLEIRCSKVDPTKAELNDGSANVEILRGNPPFQIQWSNKADSKEITKLSVGDYSVSVKDFSGQVAQCQVSLTTKADKPVPSIIPTPVAKCSAKNVTLAGCDGEVSVVASGGTPPYSYVWPYLSIEPIVKSLCPNLYTVTVTDSKQQTATCSARVLPNGPIPPLVIKCTKFENEMDGKTNIILGVEIISGTPLYTYRWSNESTDGTLYNPATGTYSVTVTDATGQTATCSISTGGGVPPEVKCIKTDLKNGKAGEALVIASSGTSPYTFLWNNGATTSKISNLKPGNYSVIVTDAKQKTASCSVTINEPLSPLEISCDKKDPSYTTIDFDGMAWVTVLKGTPPYKIQWDTKATTDTIRNLFPGIYEVVVTDATNQTDTCRVELIMKNIPMPNCIPTRKPNEYLVSHILAGNDFKNVITEAVKEGIKSHLNNQNRSELYEMILNAYADSGWVCRYIGISMGIFEKITESKPKYTVITMTKTDKEIIEIINSFGPTTNKKMIEFSAPITFIEDKNNTYEYLAYELSKDDPEDYIKGGSAYNTFNEEGKKGWELCGIYGDLVIYVRKSGSNKKWEYDSFFTNNPAMAKQQAKEYGLKGGYIFPQPIIINNEQYPNMVKMVSGSEDSFFYVTFPYKSITVRFESMFGNNPDLSAYSKSLSETLNRMGKNGFEFKLGLRLHGSKENNEIFNLLFYLPNNCEKKISN